MELPGKGLQLRLRAIKYGESLDDKIDLLATAILRSFPEPLRTRYPRLWSIFSRPREAHGDLILMAFAIY